MLSWLRSTDKHTVLSLTVTHIHTHTCTYTYTYHPHPTWFKVLKNFTKLGNDCLTKINHRRSATASWWFVCAGDWAAQLWDPMECVGKNKSYNTNFSCTNGNITVSRERRHCLSQGRAVTSSPWKKKEVAKTAWQTQLAGKLTTKKTPLQFENWSCVVAFESWYLLLSFTKHMIFILSANNHDG